MQTKKNYWALCRVLHLAKTDMPNVTLGKHATCHDLGSLSQMALLGIGVCRVSWPGCSAKSLCREPGGRHSANTQTHGSPGSTVCRVPVLGKTYAKYQDDGTWQTPRHVAAPGRPWQHCLPSSGTRQTFMTSIRIRALGKCGCHMVPYRASVFVEHQRQTLGKPRCHGGVG